MRNAVALMNEYYIPHAKRAFGGGGSLSAPAKSLCEVLRTMPQFKQNDLYRRVAGQKRYKGDTGKQAFVQVLEELKNNGYVRQLPAPEHHGRGRPADPTWEAHPDLCGESKSLKPVQEGCL